MANNNSFYSANGTTIGYKTTTEESSFTLIPYLMEVPELGGTPEKIDVTTLTDEVKKYIFGIKDIELVFKFLYDKQANYNILKGFENNKTYVDFQIKYPDNSTHTFSALPSVKMDAGSVNGALTFSATMMLSTDITVA